jgi:hypothetical protein
VDGGERGGGAAGRAIATAGAFWLLGLLLAFHPTLLTGFARIQGAPVDTRTNNYLLEGEYRWLTSGGAQELWSPAFFFPAPNVAAYGDVQLATMPIYAVWRLLGAPADTAFQLWTMAVLSLNYLFFWFFLRRIARTTPLAAAFGAFLFAFGASRVNQVGHEQLFTQFYAIFALYALCRAFAVEHGDEGQHERAIWIGVAPLAVAAQLYSGFNIGWVLGFALMVTAAWVLVLRPWRGSVVRVVRDHWRAAAAAAGLAALALAPLASHYLEAARAVGFRSWSEVEPLLPRPQSWLYLGPFNRLYGWQYDLDLFRRLSVDQEHRVGLGVATTLLAALGLYWRWGDAGTRLLVAVTVTVALCVTVPVGELVWAFVFAAIPGANAFRAVARIGMLLLIPAGIGAAYFVDRMRPRPWLLALALTASVLEQVQTTPSFDKLEIRRDVEALAARVDARCHAFLFTPVGGSERSGLENGKHHSDAMWAQHLTGRPTINGTYSNVPPGWDFDAVTLRNDADVRRIEGALGDWRTRWRLDRERVCWLRPAVDWSWARPEPLRRAVLRAWGVRLSTGEQ